MITYDEYAKIRDEKNLTDGKVAEIAGFGRSTFSDWKSGRSIPKLDKMQKIADALGMDYYEFVGPVGLYSSLNPNRPSAFKPTFNIDFAKVTAEEQNILITIMKNDDYRERLMEYAKFLKQKMDADDKDGKNQ